MFKAYVIAGPAQIGNCFGYFGKEVPTGKFAVVANSEYANGGHGPCQVGPQRLYATEEEALRVALVCRDDATSAEVTADAALVPDNWREATSARPLVVYPS